MFKRFLACILLSSALVFAQSEVANTSQAKVLFIKATDDFFNLHTKRSVKQAEKVLIFALRNNDKALAAKAYNLLGLNFEQFSDNKKAIDYYLKGVKSANEIKNDTILGWIYNNLGGIYTYNNIDIKKSTEFFIKAYKATKHIENNPEFLVATLNIGANLIQVGKFEEGKKYLDEIKKNVDKNKDVDIRLSFHTSYAAYFDIFKNDFKQAETEYLKALRIGLSDHTPSIQLNVLDLYYGIFEFYEKHKKTDLALKYLKLHDQLQKDLYDDKREAILAGEDKSIQIGEINHRIEQVEKENKNYARILTFNKYFIGFLLVLAFVFLALLYFLQKNFKKNKKINKKLKSANVELHKAKQKTLEVAKLKSKFMSTVSHELRTPLYGVIGLTDIIESEHAMLRDSKYVKSLKFSAKYLLSLINDILNLSKIESGKLELVFENVHLQEELETIVDSLEVIANQYNNNIVIDYDETIPTYIKTDKTRLSQIIINLLSNSLKFTKEGLITLKVGPIDESNLLEFAIQDNGIGIPKKYMDKIFDTFVQVESATDEQFQGTGLGLAIVKRFVELFGGTIAVESEENVGTVITFSIPLLSAELQQIEKEEMCQHKDLTNCSILVVEDNKVNQIVTQKLLEKNGMKCIIANDGYHALDILKERNFDVILMDIHMPGINGFETAAKIHEMGIGTPIIALTASDRYELEEDISHYKITDILVKPFVYKDLEALFRKYIKKETATLS